MRRWVDPQSSFDAATRVQSRCDETAMHRTHLSGTYFTRRNGKAYLYSALYWHEGADLVWQAKVWRNGARMTESGDRFNDTGLRDPDLYVRLSIEVLIEQRLSTSD
jgi:hypothetical protein